LFGHPQGAAQEEALAVKLLLKGFYNRVGHLDIGAKHRKVWRTIAASTSVNGRCVIAAVSSRPIDSSAL
jgi:hypothetical protein